MKKTKISGEFNNFNTNQTDFGKIYYALPKETFEPTTIEELADTLKTLNELSIPTTIRNTGHSVNGQTLTDKAQVLVGNIKHMHLDTKNKTITVGAGVRWTDIIQKCLNEKLCPPIFTQNPGQKIHAGGTASVGGAGIYGTKYGGFWQTVKSLKLITMTGDIINCSRQENTQEFLYALGGFGRIGVIGELTINLVENNENIIAMGIIHMSLEEHFADIRKAVDADYYEAVVHEVLLDNNNILANIRDGPFLMLIAKEIDPKNNTMEEIVEHTKKLFDRQNMIFFGATSVLKNPDMISTLDIDIHAKTLPKEELLYYYPKGRDDQMEHYHPWSDYILPLKNYGEFIQKAIELLGKYGITKYLPHQSILHGILQLNLFVAYFAKTSSKRLKFPLTLELEDDSDVHVGLTLLPTVPKEKIDDVIAMCNELTELTYKLGGKRYLYGIHELTAEQVEKQYSKPVIEKWNMLKKKYDPKHLLNIGVIEHLD